jgi:mycolipenoyl-CoA---2-(long-chain-fatty acyl)-trehalose mycolipenoyltransferase / long-chain-acyl-CoA---trehalose acyltransferase
MLRAVMGANIAPTRLRQASSDEDRCIRQHGYTSLLTLESARIRARTALGANKGRRFPDLPLPLGEPYLAAIKSVSMRLPEGPDAVRLRNVDHG